MAGTQSHRAKDCFLKVVQPVNNLPRDRYLLSSSFFFPPCSFLLFFKNIFFLKKNIISSIWNDLNMVLCVAIAYELPNSQDSIRSSELWFCDEIYQYLSFLSSLFSLPLSWLEATWEWQAHLRTSAPYPFLKTKTHLGWGLFAETRPRLHLPPR